MYAKWKTKHVVIGMFLLNSETRENALGGILLAEP